MSWVRVPQPYFIFMNEVNVKIKWFDNIQFSIYSTAPFWSTWSGLVRKGNTPHSTWNFILFLPQYKDNIFFLLSHSTLSNQHQDFNFHLRKHTFWERKMPESRPEDALAYRRPIDAFFKAGFPLMKVILEFVS